MYRCQMCGQSTKSGESIRRVVVQRREKVYRAREYKLPGKVTEGHPRKVYDPGGEGLETVRELAVCGPCEYRHWAETEARSVQVQVVPGAPR